jgi:uncharacterized protein YyaL (SSP411 family)
LSNHLITEKSPYLLLHAEHPVDWYPWSEEALSMAREENKPLFLSIGYSSCHWCHVIAKESFEDTEIAEILNRAFVAIKVDKEEQPDIDAVYMEACQYLTGSGGWPLTILATPEGKPFYAATYLPKDSMLYLLQTAETAWLESENTLRENADRITEGLKSVEPEVTPKTPSRELLNKAYQQYETAFDSVWGGFGPPPKFPTPHNLLFLLQYYRSTGESHALEMVEHTLEQMYRGGIFDHIGGGFCRYATDRNWLVPHFEKMLYDNALLIAAYAEVYATTGRELYRTVAERTVDYVLAEMTGDEGEFFGSQDADSEGVEGKFYTLTPDELDDLLGSNDSTRFCQWYGITKGGNFEGKSIPNLIRNDRYENPPAFMWDLQHRVAGYRRSRTVLRRDDKVLTAWNGMMIWALAKAAEIFDRDDYLTAALKASHFIRDHLTDKDHQLSVRWREGETKHRGLIDDYAFYTLALLELYHAGAGDDYLIQAQTITDQMLNRFFDAEQGGFYLYSSDATPLIDRPKTVYDGATPSGNAVALHVLTQLTALTDQKRYADCLQKQRMFLAGAAEQYPIGHAFSLLALFA